MQLSPLQLEEMRFLEVRIDCRETPDLREVATKYEPFEFGNTKFQSTLEHICADEIEENPITNFAVTLTINLPDEGEDPPPYVIRVKCVGYFGISKAVFPDFERRYDVGVVNGASLLYGAIRELVSSTTSRSWYGQLLLPSLNFQRNAPSLSNSSDAKKPEKAATAKKPARRKKSVGT